MAWSERLTTGRYRGLYRDAHGRKRTAPGGPFVHRAQANRAAGAAEAAARRQSWRNLDAGQRPWRDWCEAWWLTRTVEPGTLLTQASIRDVHLLPRWGDVPVAGIRRHDVKAWSAQLLASGRSPSTVQKILALLSASLKAAVDEELIEHNPAARIRLPLGQQAVERYLTGPELEAILAQLPTVFDRLVADTLASTGLRWGELAGLHRDRVDWDRGLIRVVEVYDEKTGAMKAYPKGPPYPSGPCSAAPVGRAGRLAYRGGLVRCPAPRRRLSWAAPVHLPRGERTQADELGEHLASGRRTVRRRSRPGS